MTVKAQTSISLPKSERLSSKKLIEELFKDGSSFQFYPLRLKYLSVEGLEQHQIMVTTPKKNLKLAVDRNLVKRRIKEAYRTNKHLIREHPKKFLLVFMYLSHDVQPYAVIKQKLIKLLERLRFEEIK